MGQLSCMTVPKIAPVLVPVKPVANQECTYDEAAILQIRHPWVFNHLVWRIEIWYDSVFASSVTVVIWYTQRPIMVYQHTAYDTYLEQRFVQKPSCGRKGKRRRCTKKSVDEVGQNGQAKDFSIVHNRRHANPKKVITEANETFDNGKNAFASNPFKGKLSQLSRHHLQRITKSPKVKSDFEEKHISFEVTGAAPGVNAASSTSSGKMVGEGNVRRNAKAMKKNRKNKDNKNKVSDAPELAYSSLNGPEHHSVTNGNIPDSIQNTPDHAGKDNACSKAMKQSQPGVHGRTDVSATIPEDSEQPRRVNANSKATGDISLQAEAPWKISSNEDENASPENLSQPVDDIKQIGKTHGKEEISNVFFSSFFTPKEFERRIARFKSLPILPPSNRLTMGTNDGSKLSQPDAEEVVPCKYEANGCTEAKLVNEIVQHELNCLHQPMECLNAKHGCTALVTRHNFNLHLDNECRMKACVHCNSLYHNSKISQHEDECTAQFECNHQSHNGPSGRRIQSHFANIL